jgi:hypothetical protein
LNGDDWLLVIGMLRISGRQDFWPDNPAFFDILYPDGYQIALPDIRYGRITGYPANVKLIQNLCSFPSNKARKKIAQKLCLLLDHALFIVCKSL